MHTNTLECPRGIRHNGATSLPGAVECFNSLIAANKKVVILSNTSRRANDAKGKLPGLGFDLNSIEGLLCSGEEAYKHIKAERGGQKCLWFTWEREEEAMGEGLGFLEGLDVSTADVGQADFILCHGWATHTDSLENAPCTWPSDAFGACGGRSDIILGSGPAKPTGFKSSGDVSAYGGVLKVAALRGLPMVCANPDERAMQPDGNMGHMPGAIALEYKRLGGEVTPLIRHVIIIQPVHVSSS